MEEGLAAWKVLIVLGLGMTFAGLILMIEARKYRTGKDTMWSVPAIMNPRAHRLAWILTVAGYIYQVFGVIFS